jgi:mRNA-decapping enzyme 1B
MSANSATQVARRQANLRTLQRGDSTVSDIVGSATHVGLYEFDQTSQQWNKKQVEGSLFLVKRMKLPRFKLVILNRNSTENFEVSVMPEFQLQNDDPFLIFRQKVSIETIIHGIWFHSSPERNAMAILLERAVQSLTTLTAQPLAVNSTVVPDVSVAQLAMDHNTATSVLLSPLTLGNHTIQVSKGHTYIPARAPGPVMTPQEQVTPNGQPPQLVLDKKSLQLSLLSLIQDERFLDLIHAQYLKVAHARAGRSPDTEEDNS